MADAPALTTYVTEDELMALGSDARVEVVDGEIIEMSPVGGLHEIIVQNINRILDRYVTDHNSGLVFPDGLIFYLKRSGKRLYQARVPDLSFVRADAIPSDWAVEKPFPRAPTLAVEVMSPDDKMVDVIEKTGEYFDAGTEQVWVIFPRTREIYQYRDVTNVKIYRGDDIIDVSALFPDLMLTLGAIFNDPLEKLRRR